MYPEPGEVTCWLHKASGGEPSAQAALFEIVYRELRYLADAQMRREREGHTLQATALVNEAYVKLFKEKQYDWSNRRQFFAFSAQIMRNILVDHARKHHAVKSGGDLQRVPIDNLRAGEISVSPELIALDSALNRLSAMDPRQSRIVELKYFAGCTEEEIAELLQISLRTVKREWSSAKAWLYSQMASGE